MGEEKIVKLPVPVSDADHARGPAGAPVTVVKYGDYECPDCHKAHQAVLRMARQLENRVRFVYRHFPLVGVHPRALRAAEAAEAAAAQERFWEMHEMLYTNPNRLGDDDLRKYAHRIGLDMTRFDRELAEGDYAERILRDREHSIIEGISGTPTFYINDVRYAATGERLFEIVRAMVEGRAVNEQ